MKRALRLIAAILVVATVVFVLLSPGAEAPSTESQPVGEPGAGGDSTTSRNGTEKVVILHTNDFHGAIEPETRNSGEAGGLVNLVSLIDQFRAEDPERTLLLDAGDTFQGTYLSNSTQGEVVMAAMNIAGYDAWALGNHEFDWGQESLKARIDQASFPVLAANLQNADTGQMWGKVKPYTIVEAGRARIAVLGLTYPNTPGINKPQNVADLKFRGAAETVRQYLPEMEEQADLVIVLSHAGYDTDMDLARTVKGIDLIIGGHSHTYVERPRQVGDTLVAQAGAKGQVLGRLELTVHLETGKIVEVGNQRALQQVTGDVSPVNQEVKDLVNAAIAKARETMNQPIGETVKALEPQRVGEFALGNLVVDAMLAADVDGRPADIATHNNAGIRDGLPKGPVNYGQLYAVLPFDNQLMAMDLTGKQVLEILEHSVSNQAGKLQVAGLAFRFDMSRRGGSRVLEVNVGGQPLDLERVYRMVTIDYLASGGDGYDTFAQGADPSYGDNEVWVVAEYIRAQSPIDPRVEGRIVEQ
jgi:2',3'-cyclic-nucleotide 2'-phosphodiesterase (5'-nucleotidase family)